MKKKILSIALVVCLLATALVSGTLAYFTDTDAAKNVMTTGKVDIIQLEQEYEKETEGTLKDFAPNKPLMPMVNNCGANDSFLVEKTIDGNENISVFNDKANNVVEKFISVKNEAKNGAINQDVYARTILAFETATEYEEDKAIVRRDGKEIFGTYIGYIGDFELLSRDTIVIDGVEYVLAVKVYDKALAPQEESGYSLKQFFLSPDAGNEVYEFYDGKYTILALSQATQTAGFADAETALNEAFGDLETVEEDKLIEWLSACK